MSEASARQKMSPKDLMIVLVISLGSFMAGLDVTIVNIALPSIGKAFDVSTVTVSWVLNAYLIILISLLLASSRLGDMKGYRKIFLAGFILFTIGSALCGLAPGIDVLILSRMLQAVGGAIIAALGAVMVTSYLEIVKHLPTDNAGTVLLALPIGMILTSPIAGRISDVIGTKKPIILGFVICVLALFLLSTIGLNTSIGHAVIYLFLLGAGTGIAYAPLNSAVMGESPVKERGTTSGLIKMMTNLGSSLGVARVILVATVALGPELAHATASRTGTADPG